MTDLPRVQSLRPDREILTKQRLPYFVGISGQTVGAAGLSMHLVVIPPGARADPHLHLGYETGIYVLEGEVRTRWGAALEHDEISRAGDFLYIPPGVPHEAINLSATEPARAVVARNDAAEQDRVQPYVAGAAPAQAATAAPAHRTEPALLAIRDELMAREPLFHRAEHGRTPAAFDAMMAADFHEVGASGRRYDRAQVLQVLAQRYAEGAGTRDDDERWQADAFDCQALGTDHYLLTYTLRQGARTTRRATIWRRAPHGWVVVYHQGTPADAA